MKPALNHMNRLMNKFLRNLNLFLDYDIISQGLDLYNL
jgi:hypothetical protein